MFSKNGRTPLHTAALHASYQTVDFLLSVGCSCNRFIYIRGVYRKAGGGGKGGSDPLETLGKVIA